MAITRVQVENFKSFGKLDQPLGRFNVVVGANAAGKSNFVNLFRFVRDISNEGLENAVSLQGAEYLPNMGVGSSNHVSIKLYAAPEIEEELGLKMKLGKSVVLEAKDTSYEFALIFETQSSKFKVDIDKLTLNVSYFQWDVKKRQITKESLLGDGNIILSRVNDEVKFDVSAPEKVVLKPEDMFPRFITEAFKSSANTLLLEMPHFSFILPPSLQRNFGDIAIYDFDPKLSKKAVPVAGKSELDEDAGNLSLVLKGIVEDSEKKRKFSNLIKDLLPFVEDLGTDRFADKSLLFKLREKYFCDRYFPASFISDGTVNISALLVALYFERQSLAIIEEPERNMHPRLISRVMDMMKDASKNKQIIVTTHSPEVVKHAGLENLLLVSRDKDGFSTISRPAENEEVQVFLKNEMGLDELYIQNLLGK